MTEPRPTPDELRPQPISVRNSVEPIELAGVQLNGVSAENAQSGQTEVKVWTRLCITSDDRLFHRIADGLNNHIEHIARQGGRVVNLKHAHTVLLVIHPDDTGDLWVDTAAMIARIMAKRDMVPG